MGGVEMTFTAEDTRVKLAWVYFHSSQSMFLILCDFFFSYSLIIQ